MDAVTEAMIEGAIMGVCFIGLIWALWGKR